MTTRQAYFEGRFYPSTKSELFRQIREIAASGRYPPGDLEVQRIYGAVLPHAGHIYSGYQTIPFFQLLSRLEIYPDSFVIVHPNHTGNGPATAVDTSDYWVNAAGEVPVDREFAEALELTTDRTAHLHEHSAEVIIPFIQHYMEGRPFSIVPVCLRDQGYENAARVAERIRLCEAQLGRDLMVIASSDFSHFLPAREGAKKDQLVLDRITGRDPGGVEKVIVNHRVSVCGYGPIITLMEYAASKDRNYLVEILARGHSGEVTPSMEVVNYISMILYN